MATEKIKNNAIVPDPDSNQDKPVKRKGRPKGATDKQERKKRTDYTVNASPGENSKMIQYAMTLMNLPKVDINNTEEVKQRINEFFTICNGYDFKPSVAALASAFGISRMTLFSWLNERTETIKNKECLYTLKQAYDSINALYEVYMNNGKINPVAGIFLMKNNMGYKDTTDYIVTSNQEQQASLPDIVNRAGLLSE